MAEQEWTEKYNEARKLYANGMDFDVLSLLLNYKDATEFENKILFQIKFNAISKKLDIHFYKLLQILSIIVNIINYIQSIFY